ncbi:hypothetical protein ACS0TY_003897 [Phlomoides rotata]
MAIHQILRRSFSRERRSAEVPKGHFAVYVGENEKKRFVYVKTEKIIFSKYTHQGRETPASLPSSSSQPTPDGQPTVATHDLPLRPPLLSLCSSSSSPTLFVGVASRDLRVESPNCRLMSVYDLTFLGFLFDPYLEL